MMMRMGVMALTLAALLVGQDSRAADSCTVEAGPLWSGTDANNKCPSTCQNSGFAAWTGQWWTTVPGQMSVCQCQDKLTAVEAGPLWSGTDANNKCPSTCQNNGYSAWTGQWWTTVPGQMSVCQCKNKLIAVEAGPLWSGTDANNKCPSTCSANSGIWTGQWWTTVPGQMSVCQCGSLCS